MACGYNFFHLLCCFHNIFLKIEYFEKCVKCRLQMIHWKFVCNRFIILKVYLLTCLADE